MSYNNNCCCHGEEPIYVFVNYMTNQGQKQGYFTRGLGGTYIPIEMEPYTQTHRERIIDRRKQNEQDNKNVQRRLQGFTILTEAPRIWPRNRSCCGGI